MTFLNRWPLRTTIPLLLLFSIIVIGTFTWAYNTSLTNEEIERAARYELTVKMTSIQRRLNYDHRQNNIEGIQQEISATSFDRNVTKAFLVDEHNIIISATRLAMIGSLASASSFGVVPHENIFAHLEGLKDSMTGSIALTRDRQTLVGYFPVLMGGKGKGLRPFRVGILCLHYDLTFLKASANRTLTLHTIQYSGFLLFVSILLWFYFHLTMTKRVAALIRTTARFAAGDRDIQSGLTGQDEIARIGEALDKMIRERKQVEEKLQKAYDDLSESEVRYQNIFETIPDALFIADLNGDILEANSAACQIYGYSSEEFKGLNALNLITPVYHSVYKDFLADLTAYGTFRGETIDVRKDKSTFDTEVGGTTFYYKGEKRLVAIIRDISKRKQAEAALKESELLYRALFRKNRSVMLLIDPDTASIVDANPSACSYYGYSKQVITGMKISDINVLSKEEVHSEMKKAKTEQRNYFNFRHRLANGDIHDVEVHSGPIKVGGRSLLCSIVHDISQRKAAERERDRLILKLQKALDEIKTLKGIVPICANCKKIRDDKGYWNLLESYIEKYSEASFSHGMCPECSDKLYGHEEWYIKMKKKKEKKD